MYLLFAWLDIPYGGISDLIDRYPTAEEAQNYAHEYLDPMAFSWQVVDVAANFAIVSESSSLSEQTIILTPAEKETLCH